MLFLKEYKNELNNYIDKYKHIFDKYRTASILITGAAGLIGSYIADLFLAANKLNGYGITLYLVDRNEELLYKRFKNEACELFFKDIVNNELSVNSIDYVFHCASNTSPADYAKKPIDTILTNIVGTNNILRLALATNAKRVLFCPSVEAYGKNNGDVDSFTESYSGYVDCNTLRAAYPSAKRCAEALLNAYKTEYTRIEFVTARIGRFYGPTVIPGDTKAPSQFITDAVRGNDIILKSNGLQEYSWGYVGDCATALITIIVKGTNGEVYNIADPNSKCRLKDFAQACADVGGVRVVHSELSANEKKGYSCITKALLDTTKMESLGWAAEYSIKDGIERTVKYLKALQEV